MASPSCIRSLTCIGNPLIEIHAEVQNAFLQQYNLKPNVAVQMEQKHQYLLTELVETGSLQPTYAPGGAAATVALTVVALKRANEQGRIRHSEDSDADAKVQLLGGVGRDDLASKLRQLCQEQGIGVLFSDTDTVLTGWRAVLRTHQDVGKSEGLGAPPGEDHDFVSEKPMQVSTVTFTGAAREYKLDHMRFKEWDSIESTDIFYVDALFLTVSMDSARIVAEHCTKMEKVLCLHLSARYLCASFADRIVQLIPYTDYVFGNESEYMELARAHKEDVGSGFEAAASFIAKIPRADGSPKKKRHVIATNGTKPCVVASLWRGYGVKVQRFPVPPVRTGRLVCKDGAGDAFTGGFLFGLMHEADLESCVQMALHAANGAVQRRDPKFTFKERPSLEKQAQTES